MAVPLSQMYTVTKYVLTQRVRRVTRYPLVLMLEPLFRCNLACAGCGKIQYPDHILDRRLTPEQCWAAAEECGAPIVSILSSFIPTIYFGVLIGLAMLVALMSNLTLLPVLLMVFQPLGPGTRPEMASRP